MNTELAKKNAEAMLAWAEGKPIQYRYLGNAEGWIDSPLTGELRFDFQYFAYRIKPAPPVECWAIVDRRGKFRGTFSAKEDAAQLVKTDFIGGRCFLMREVVSE